MASEPDGGGGPADVDLSTDEHGVYTTDEGSFFRVCALDEGGGDGPRSGTPPPRELGSAAPARGGGGGWGSLCFASPSA